jgi:PAS domain-containing protein
MKIRQNLRHWAAKQGLTMPVVGDLITDRLVSLHTGIFLEWADEDRREERRERLDAFFDATMDVYVQALRDGIEEATAREITHIQANFDFYNHGWTEMMEFPADELQAHYDRHATFFQRYDVTIEDPLGEFAPPDGLPSAPSTPEKLADPDHPHAEGGFADDVYVETGDGDLVVGGTAEPDDVDVAAAPGVDQEAVEDSADA